MGFSPIALLLLFAILFSCGSTKETETPNEDLDSDGFVKAEDDNRGMVMIKEPMELVFYFMDLTPHCGGAAPMENEEFPKVSPIRLAQWTVFKVNERGGRGQRLGELLSSNEGRSTYRLQPGKYQLWWKSKTLTFEEFYERESPDMGNMKEYKNEDCFRDWFETPDFEFEVVDDSTYTINYENRCFVNRHPCLIYTGPPPP